MRNPEKRPEVHGIPEKFLFEGRAFSLEELLDHCRELSGDDSVQQWKKHVCAFVNRFLDPAMGAITQKTSGTTGIPRDHLLNRSSMIRSAESTLEFFNLKPGTQVLLCLPVEYIAGKMMVVRALVGQLDLWMVEPSARPLKDFRENAGFASMVPLQVYESLEAGDRLSSLETLLVGGGELHHSLRAQLSGFKQPRIYESFGMTETYTHFALRRINGELPEKRFRSLPGVSLGTDEVGCLEVEFAGVTDGRISTRDLVEIDPGDDSFLWLGRYDNVISTGGIKVIPEMAEERIGTLTGRECLLLPEPDPRLGQRLVLLIESPEKELDTTELQSKLRGILPGHELPRRIVPVDAIPRNPSFKPDRNAARRLI